MSLSSCRHRKVIADASQAVEHRDYKKALKSILSLDDDVIAGSDTLSQMLSTAYYGSTLVPDRRIAGDCYDMDYVPAKGVIVFTDFAKGSLNFYKYPEMEFMRSVTLPAKAYGIDVSPDGSLIAAAMVDDTILLCDFETGKVVKTLVGHTGRVRAVAFRDTAMLFSCGNDRAIAAWNVADGKPYWGKRLAEKNIKNLSLSKDKTRLITASNDGTACVIAADSDKGGDELLRLVHGENYVNDVAISPDNKYCVTVSGDGYMKMWDGNDGTLLKYVFLNDPLSAVDISDDGRYIIVGGNNVYLLDPAECRVISKINGVNVPVWTVRIVGDSDFIFADNSRFWHGKILVGNDLVDEARKVERRQPASHSRLSGAKQVLNFGAGVAVKLF